MGDGCRLEAIELIEGPIYGGVAEKMLAADKGSGAAGDTRNEVINVVILGGCPLGLVYEG